MRADVLGLILFCLTSCQKTDRVFPDITSEGHHHLGFYIDHEEWIPQSDPYFEDHELPTPIIEDGKIKISASRTDEKNSARNWFCMEFENPEMKTGVFIMNENGCPSIYQSHYYGSKSHKQSQRYHLNERHHNFVNLSRFDTVQKIISGTFSLSAISNLNDTINISSGRFDLQY